MKKLLIGILMVCLIFGFNIVSAKDIKPWKSLKYQTMKIVFISGVENGVCVVPNVNLWSKPGGVVIYRVNGCTRISVKVTKIKHINGRIWYHIKTFGSNAGKSGWLLDTFIKK